MREKNKMTLSYSSEEALRFTNKERNSFSHLYVCLSRVQVRLLSICLVDLPLSVQNNSGDQKYYVEREVVTIKDKEHASHTLLPTFLGLDILLLREMWEKFILTCLHHSKKSNKKSCTFYFFEE